MTGRAALRAAPQASAPADDVGGALQQMAESLTRLFRLGCERFTQGQRGEASELFRAILQVLPQHADSLHILGVIAYQEGRNSEALELIGQALNLDPSRPDYANNLGNALQKSSRLADAEICYRAALQIDPTHAPSHNNIAALLRERGQPEAAIESAERALALRPGYAEAHNNRAIALSDLGRFEAAAAECRLALEADPSRIETRNNLANILTHLGQLDEALAHYEQALAEAPDAAEVHHNYALTLLCAGRYAEGWREYEWRWQTGHLAKRRRTFEQPQWDGSPLGERTLLVHAEQGFGDTLQFCRYAARVRGRVIIEVQPELVALLRGQIGAAAVIAAGEPLPPFDVHCPLLSLPGRVEAEPDPEANARPYLFADPARVAAWKARLSTVRGLKVGLVWAGGARPDQPTLAAVNRRRSTTLAQFARLAELGGVSLISLQKGPPADELAALSWRRNVYDFTADLHDFADTAALVEALDLVISVDTAVAHLAGALGKPVWLLNRFDSCWRWRAEGTGSLWYPTLTQFRQPSPGDWATPIAVMATKLLFGEGRLRARI